MNGPDRASKSGSPYYSPDPAIVAALNQASPSVVNLNDDATEKLVHAME